MNELLNDGLEPSQIVFISPDNDTLKISKNLCSQLNLDFAVVDQDGFDYRSHTGKVLVATVEGYKGLERSVVLLVGFWTVTDIPILRSNFYKAVSRSNHTVFVAADERLRSVAQTFLVEHLMSKGSK